MSINESEIFESVEDPSQEEGVFGPDLMAEEPEPEPVLPFDPDARVQELMTRFDYADSFRSQYDAKAVEWYKSYVGHRPKREELPEEQRDRSNLHIPRTYEIIDSLRARFVRSFFDTKPYMDFSPVPMRGDVPQTMVLRTEKAKIASALVDSQLDRNKIKSKFYDYVTSFLVFPAAILSVGWRYDVRMVRRKIDIPIVQRDAMGTPVVDETGNPVITGFHSQIIEEPSIAWDDNEIKNVDYFDFWIDPRGRDLDSARFVFEREFLTQEQIEDKLLTLQETGLGTIFPLDWDALRHASEGMEQGKDERLAAVGIAPETSEGHWGDDPEDQRKGNLYEVLWYCEDQRKAMILNRTALAYEGDSPFWRHQKKPYVMQSFDPLPNEPYGLSAVQIVHHLQEEKNTTRNQRIDAVSMVLNRMWKVRRGADVDESELVSRNHGIIHVDQQDDVEDFPMRDIPRSAFVDEQVLDREMENAPGVPSVVRGVDPSRAETATEIVTKSSAAGVRFDVKIMLYESLGLQRLAMLMDLNNQQFMSIDRLIPVYGVDMPLQWVQVHPGQLVGEFEYRPSGANVDPGANREFRREQLNQLMGVVLATQNPYIDMYELTRMWLESHEIRNTERLILPREIVDQQQAMAQQQQMMHEQLVAGRPDRQADGGQPQLPPVGVPMG